MSVNRFIFDAVRHYAETRAEQAALVFDGRITSFAELELRARRVASGLVSLGLKQQSRVAILTGNNDYFFEIWLGAALGNYVLTPINARLAPPEIVYIVNDSQAQVLIVDGPFQELVEGIARELTTVRQVISLDAHGEWPIYSHWRDEQSSDPLQAASDPADTMVQMYTSGTTGFPKGVDRVLGQGHVGRHGEVRQGLEKIARSTDSRLIALGQDVQAR